MALLNRLLHRKAPEMKWTLKYGDNGSASMENTEAASNSEKDKKGLLAGLTDREYDLYLLLLEGYTPRECSDMLEIKYSVTKACIPEVFRKLKVSTRAELIINYRGITK